MQGSDSKEATNADGDSNRKVADRDELIFELIKKRYDNEWQRITNLDNKASNLVGYVSLVAGLLLGSATFTLSSSLVCKPILSSAYFIGIAVLLSSIVSALLASRVRKWPNVPNVQVLLDSYTTLPYDEVLKSNAATMASAIEKIELQNNRKASLINWSWYFLISGLTLVLSFVILYTLYGAEPCLNE
ncbi:MAG TPA: hypothetical protein VE130_11525 [Nitrososphaeraceae archaeon]|nr:hypothetical protein [Nitrososphaeraceae archaeon]